MAQKPDPETARALLEKYLPEFALAVRRGEGDSDEHLLTLFSVAQACKGESYVELGVRGGHTTLPLLLAAYLNGGHLYSVDIEETEFECPPELANNWTFIKQDAVQFLEKWDENLRMDFVYLDDWHAYPHVKKELEQIDRYVGPSSVILVHDLMYGHTEPFYHSDMTLPDGQWAEGGPYRAVAELPLQFWEWATLPWNHGLTLLRKKYSRLYHRR